jgi:serine/threonine protein kinase
VCLSVPRAAPTLWGAQSAAEPIALKRSREATVRKGVDESAVKEVACLMEVAGAELAAEPLLSRARLSSDVVPPFLPRGVFIHRSHLFVATERFHCDLGYWIEHGWDPSDVGLSVRRGARLARELLVDLSKLHAMGWLHRDVKPGNVLIMTGGPLHARLCDFGLACKFPMHPGTGSARAPVAPSDVWEGAVGEECVSRPTAEANKDSPFRGHDWSDSDESDEPAAAGGLACSHGRTPRRRMCAQAGTLWYRAPELLVGAKVQGPGLDVWGAGMVLWECVGGVRLVEGSSELSQLKGLMELVGRIDAGLWPTLGDTAPHFFASPPAPESSDPAPSAAWRYGGFVLPRTMQLYQHRLSGLLEGLLRDARGAHELDRLICDLVSHMMLYDPDSRPTALECLTHPLFEAVLDVSALPLCRCPSRLPAADSPVSLSESVTPQRARLFGSPLGAPGALVFDSASEGSLSPRVPKRSRDESDLT